MTPARIVALLSVFSLAACGSSSGQDAGVDAGSNDAGPNDAGPNDAGSNDAGTDAGTPFPQPAGTVAVNFSVDDTANKVFAAGDLKWKASMKYDETTRKIERDMNWVGPFATLFDDGSWEHGGHEPKGAVAADHKWGVTVFAPVPASGSDAYEYGLNDDYYERTYGNGWIWQGSNGSFTVSAGATAEINTTGATLPAFGTRDLQLTIDLQNLPTDGGPFDTSKISVKGSAWLWNPQQLPGCTAASATCTFTLSEVVGAGHAFPHTGLLAAGAKASFVFVFNTKEFKDSNGTAHTQGVTAKVKHDTTWTAATVKIGPDKNTYVDVP